MLAETNGKTVQPSRREDLLREMAQEEARLQRLEAEQATARARLAAVQAELATLDAEPQIRVRLPLVAEAPVPRTSAEKVKLFRSLFRGREEVFPTRFVSKKTGQARLCARVREQVRERCLRASKGEVRRVPEPGIHPVRRCRGRRAPHGPSRDGGVPAPRRRNLLVPRRRLRQEHMEGRRKRVRRDQPARRSSRSRWRDRDRATAPTSGSSSPRRSRRASRARWAAISSPRRCRAGTSSSMESYDRLFPSQDTMPRGGFGNLIALPLQHEPRQAGNSGLR